eukprot:1224669-Heterocapsa_arctica.AAC.1
MATSVWQRSQVVLEVGEGRCADEHVDTEGDEVCEQTRAPEEAAGALEQGLRPRKLPHGAGRVGSAGVGDGAQVLGVLEQGENSTATCDGRLNRLEDGQGKVHEHVARVQALHVVAGEPREAQWPGAVAHCAGPVVVGVQQAAMRVAWRAGDHHFAEALLDPREVEQLTVRIK